LINSDFTKNNPLLGSSDTLCQQLAERLRHAQAQELVTLIGEDTLTSVFQVLFPDVISDIFSEMKDLGVSVDEELRAMIHSNKPTVVRHAVDALQEAVMQGRADYPSNFLKSAIQGKWKPNSLKRVQVS